jgi:hypothetical protein
MAHRKNPRRRNTDRLLRDHVLYLLRDGGGHVGFDKAIANIPIRLRGRKVRGQPLTVWRILEHMRIAQWDILEFSRDPSHESPAWPDGYWPDGDAPKNASAWRRSVQAFRKDLRAMEALVARRDLLAPFTHGHGQTLLREALLVADHNAYHLGQIVFLRKLLGSWQ